MIVRAATNEDVDVLCALNKIVHEKHVREEPWMFKPEGWTPDMVRAALAKPENIILVATEPKVIGYAYIEKRTFPETPLTHSYEVVHVHHISVWANDRRTGVATALMNEVQRLAGDTRITADVWAFNDEALGFFGRNLKPYLLRHWQR